MFIEVLGRKIEVIPSKRNKRLRMRVVPPDAQIKVSCPPRTPVRAVEKFVVENAVWIERATAKVKKLVMSLYKWVSLVVVSWV